MLARVIVSNFLSIKEEIDFNMFTGPFEKHKHHIYQQGKSKVLKSAVIYGANGAGKSNVIKSLHYVQALVDNGFIEESINDKKFKLDSTFLDKPVHFELEFFVQEKLYSYGLTIDNTTILEEWLYEVGINKKDKIVFERTLGANNKPSIKLAAKYQKTQKSKLLIELLEDSLVKNNQVLISRNEELGITEINDVKEWIVDYLRIIYPHYKFSGLVETIATSKRFKLFANDILKTLDTGANELDIIEIDLDKFLGEDDERLRKTIIERLKTEPQVELRTSVGNVTIIKSEEKYIVKKTISIHHNNLGERVSFDLDEESDGTQRLLDYIPAIDLILRAPVTFVIDEIDQSLHPSLLKSLIKKVMDDETTKGQLIFSTHESNLLDLDIFRQDEIWFVEKEKETGASHTYSLGDFNPRYDLDIKKGYLNGRFGAIPFLADLENLKWNSHAKTE